MMKRQRGAFLRATAILALHEDEQETSHACSRGQADASPQVDLSYVSSRPHKKRRYSRREADAEDRPKTRPATRRGPTRRSKQETIVLGLFERLVDLTQEFYTRMDAREGSEPERCTHVRVKQEAEEMSTEEDEYPEQQSQQFRCFPDHEENEPFRYEQSAWTFNDAEARDAIGHAGPDAYVPVPAQADGGSLEFGELMEELYDDFPAQSEAALMWWSMSSDIKDEPADDEEGDDELIPRPAYLHTACYHDLAGSLDIGQMDKDGGKPSIVRVCRDDEDFVSADMPVGGWPAEAQEELAYSFGSTERDREFDGNDYKIIMQGELLSLPGILDCDETLSSEESEPSDAPAESAAAEWCASFFA